jgi:hypothetical protein
VSRASLNQYGIGTVGLSPAVMGVRIVSKRMGNIPARQVNAQHARTPCSSHPETFFFPKVGCIGNGAYYVLSRKGLT